MRRLLYHRGIDDSAGTFITDYTTGILALIFAVFATAAARKIRSYERDLLHVSEKTSEEKLIHHLCSRMIALTMLFYSCSGMLLFGGIVHQMVTEVPHIPSVHVFEDLQSHREELMFLYILWQVGCFSGTTFAVFIIVYSINLLVSHCTFILNIKSSSVLQRIFTSKYCKHVTISIVVTITLLQLVWRFFCIYRYTHTTNDNSIVLVFKDEIEAYKKERLYSIWAMELSTMLLLVAVLFFVAVSIFLACSNAQISTETRSQTIDNRADGIRCEEVSTSSTEEFITASDFQLIPKFSNGFMGSVLHGVSRRNTCFMRLFAAIIIFLSGAIQYTLGLFCDDDISCPLPSTFNHNAIFHLLLGVGLTILAVAELLYVFTFLCKLKFKLNISHV